ncbi:hypothetical protein E4U47_002731 [Claviceps purpurea]|nr:hypothetical protein E4U47_002731 [Claviceps purpurea]
MGHILGVCSHPLPAASHTYPSGIAGFCVEISLKHVQSDTGTIRTSQCLARISSGTLNT